MMAKAKIIVLKLTISSISLFALDIATKLSALKIVNRPYEIIPDLLQFKTVINTGIAFSIPIPNYVMIVAAPLLIAYACTLILKSFGKQTWPSCALLIAGGIGNLFDRVLRGGVVDFIDFSFWPSFNLADMYLTAAAFLLILNYGKIIGNGKPK